jgi:HD-like signal output (HDOD) protein
VSDPSLAKQTVERATAALKTGRISTMPEVIKLVHTLSRKDNDISAMELAELVKRDAGVLAKTLMIANGFGYNPNGIRVESAMEAIQVIGFERVRTLALALMLVEQTNRGRSADEQREAAAHALCSGFIAQSVGDAQGTVRGEHAYVCAALRHFGRIVMTSFMTEEYRRAVGLAGAVPEDAAFREIFGLTPLELGHELLRAEQLPEEILSALRACDPESITASAVTPEQRMLALADFSTQLCELVFTDDLDAAAFAKRTADLAGRFSHLLPNVAAQIPETIANVGVQFSRLKHGLGIRSLPLKCVERLKDRVAKRDPRDARFIKTAPPFPLSGAPNPILAVGTAPAPIGDLPAPTASPPPPKPTVSSSRLSSGLDQLKSLVSQPGTPADVINRTVIDIVGEAFNSPEVILLLRAPRLPTLHITHGVGQNWRKLQTNAKVTPGERTTMGLCLARKENLLIHDAGEASIAPYVPSWLRDAVQLQSYVLMPIVQADQPIGVILAGWAIKRKIVIAPDQVQLLRELLVIVGRKNIPQ